MYIRLLRSPCVLLVVVTVLLYRKKVLRVCLAPLHLPTNRIHLDLSSFTCSLRKLAVAPYKVQPSPQSVPYQQPTHSSYGQSDSVPLRHGISLDFGAKQFLVKGPNFVGLQTETNTVTAQSAMRSCAFVSEMMQSHSTSTRIFWTRMDLITAMSVQRVPSTWTTMDDTSGSSTCTPASSAASFTGYIVKNFLPTR